MSALSSSDSASDSAPTSTASSALDRIRVAGFLGFFAGAFLMGVLVLAFAPFLPSHLLGSGVVVLSIGGWLVHLVWNRDLRLSALLGRVPTNVNSWTLVVTAAAGLYLLGQFELHVVVPLLETQAPGWADDYAMGASDGASPPSLFQIGASVLVLPVLEEILFRGVIFSRWRHAWAAPWRSAVVTSGLFMLLHGHLLSSFVFSVVTILLYVSTRSLWAPIAMHVLLNGTAALGGLPAASWVQAIPGMDERAFGLVAFVGALGLIGGLVVRTKDRLHAPLPYHAHENRHT